MILFKWLTGTAIKLSVRYFYQLGPTGPSWSVSRHVRLSVCVRHRETPTSRGRVDLWSKIAFLILVWDDTIFKKRGGPIFFQNC